MEALGSAARDKQLLHTLLQQQACRKHCSKSRFAPQSDFGPNDYHIGRGILLFP